MLFVSMIPLQVDVCVMVSSSGRVINSEVNWFPEKAFFVSTSMVSGQYIPVLMQSEPIVSFLTIALINPDFI